MELDITYLRRRFTVDQTLRLPPNLRLSVLHAARPMLMLSLACLAAAPIVAGDSYSIVEHTVSEAGGQGFDGAWLVRVGVMLASVGVFASSFAAAPPWSGWGKVGMRLYATFLVGSAAFSDLTWDGASGDEVEAFMHTFFTFCAGLWFVVGVAGISVERPVPLRWPQIFDRLVIGAMILVPTVMMVVDQVGLLQRLLILLGYVWLFLELTRASRFVRDLVSSGSG